MINSFCCWNCCGLRKESDAIHCQCPNCGGDMDKSRHSIDLVRQFKPELLIEENGGNEFASIGSLLSGESLLMSYAMTPEYVEIALGKSNLVALFVRPQDAPKDTALTLVLTERPQVDFFRFHNWLIGTTDFYGRSIESQISPAARIHSSVVIARQNVIIDAGVEIAPNVTIRPNTHIGPSTFIAPGVVIGIDGARLIPDGRGGSFRAIHAGGVRIGYGSFVGANTVIMKSVWSAPTVIGDRVFIGNLCNIAHNTHIKDNATLLPGVILCGRVVVESGATIAPGAVISDGLTVRNDAHVTLGAVVTKDVEASQRVSGNFAVPHERLIEHVKELSERSLYYTSESGHWVLPDERIEND